MARYWSLTGTLVCIIITMEAIAATQFKVGGNQGWAPPSGSEKETYNQWAERYRFLINDTLVFTYNPSVDSVLVVNKQDYDTCTTSNPINSYKDGNTNFPFPKPGPFYFISGNATNCQKGEKLVIVVLSPRNPRGKSKVSPAPAPTVASPPPPSSLAPSPAPITVATPPSAAPVASPFVAPVVSPTVASAPSGAGVPAIAPGKSAPQISSPIPAPMGTEGGGVVPSASAGNGIIHPCFVSASLAVSAFLAFSVAY